MKRPKLKPSTTAKPRPPVSRTEGSRPQSDLPSGKICRACGCSYAPWLEACPRCQSRNIVAAEDIEHAQFLKTARLVLRREAARRDQTVIEYLEGVGILTADDRRQQSDLDLYTSGADTPEELAAIMRRAPYVRELIKTYRPQLYTRTAQPGR